MIFVIFAICYQSMRWYYGSTAYHCVFWTYQYNIQNLLNFTSPYNLFHMGAGIIFAFIATVFLGNKAYLPFILGYTIPMLCVASFISNFNEHRVFYPVMVLLAASIVSFSNIKADRLNKAE